MSFISGELLLWRSGSVRRKHCTISSFYIRALLWWRRGWMGDAQFLQWNVSVKTIINLKFCFLFFKKLCQSETSVVFGICFSHFTIFTDTWKMVFMLKIRWTAWQDQMLACMVDKYPKAKYRMAQKMISTTASEDMLTKGKNLVRD